MYFKLFKRAARLSCYSLSGLSLYYLVKNEKFRNIAHASWTTDFQPSTVWDSNWDHRCVTSIVKPIPEGSSPEKQNEYNEKLEKHRGKATRHLILIRHGQYNLNGLNDIDRKLTELGREQAKLTGDRLKELEFPINEVVISTMTRAQETGKIILGQLGNHLINVQDCSMIEEGAVFPPEPKLDYWNPDDSEFFIDNARIEAAFRKYFHRADPAQKEDSYTVLVCHGNVIRYFVCRALQIPPEAWLRMSLHHASITWLVIHPSGRVVLRLLGDCGHMSRKKLSVQ